MKSKSILGMLGYEIDSNGNVLYGQNQMAIVSLENSSTGGVLRMHGTDDEFFYSGDILLREKELLFPSKITSKYVYFSREEETVRVDSREFVENALKAFSEFNKISSKRLAG